MREESDDKMSSENSSESEGLAVKIAREVKLPSKEEVDKRMVIHIPYRWWREHCVKGKGVGHPHGIKRRDKENPPVI